MEGYWTLPADETVTEVQRLGNMQVASKMSSEAASKKIFEGKHIACCILKHACAQSAACAYAELQHACTCMSFCARST